METERRKTEKCHDKGPGKPDIWDLREKRRLDYPWGGQLGA